MWCFFFHHVNSTQTLLFFLSFFLFFFLLRMHWFRKTPWHVVSAGSIRRSQLAFSWSSAYLSRPCHTSRCFINISKNRRRPVFFYLSQKACEVVRENYKPNWMLYMYWQRRSIPCGLQYNPFSFLFFFFLFMTASENGMGGGTYE